MTPTLTRTGLLLFAVGALFALAGAFTAAWPLIALGTVQICALLVLYLIYLPASVMLKRRYLEFAWWVPPDQITGGALLADRPMDVTILLRNQSPLRMSLQRIRVVCSRSIELHDPHLAAVIRARREVRIKLRATPRAAGYWFFQGMSVELGDRFGLLALHVYYPNLMGIKVFPRVAAARGAVPFHPRTGAMHERAGVRVVRQPGLGTDLREIRDHIPGDPFKRIAWKATARRRKLMVREFDSEIQVTHWLLLDISSTMRVPGPGRSKLDYGMGLCAAFARLALESGDRVGLITFDHRVYGQVKPSDGNPQLFRIIDQLMELHTVVDEDLTDLTDPELYAAIAEYLRYQEGTDVSTRAASPDDPSRFVAGPESELYNVDVMERAVLRSLKNRPRPWASRWRKVAASSPLSAQLRRFCRLSGLELPYRQHSFLEGKERGMADAIARAGASRRSQFIVLVSDMEELTNIGQIVDALSLARRRHHSINVVAPFSPSFMDPRRDGHGRRVHSILALRGARQRKHVRREVERLGIPVISAGPRDALQLLLRRLSRVRVLRTGTGG